VSDPVAYPLSSSLFLDLGRSSFGVSGDVVLRGVAVLRLKLQSKVDDGKGVADRDAVVEPDADSEVRVRQASASAAQDRTMARSILKVSKPGWPLGTQRVRKSLPKMGVRACRMGWQKVAATALAVSKGIQ